MMPQYRNEKFVLKKYCAPQTNSRVPPVTVRASMMVLNTLKADVFKSISSMFIPFFLAKQRYQM